MGGLFASNTKTYSPVYDAPVSGDVTEMEILKGASTLVAGAVAIAAATLF